MKKRVTQALLAPAPRPLVPNEFWHYVSRLASEVQIRVAIDEVARSQEQGAVKQIRLYALHEKLRQVSANRNLAYR